MPDSLQLQMWIIVKSHTRTTKSNNQNNKINKFRAHTRTKPFQLHSINYRKQWIYCQFAYSHNFIRLLHSVWLTKALCAVPVVFLYACECGFSVYNSMHFSVLHSLSHWINCNWYDSFTIMPKSTWLRLIFVDNQPINADYEKCMPNRSAFEKSIFRRLVFRQMWGYLKALALPHSTPSMQCSYIMRVFMFLKWTHGVENNEASSRQSSRMLELVHINKATCK